MWGVASAVCGANLCTPTIMIREFHHHRGVSSMGCLFRALGLECRAQRLVNTSGVRFTLVQLIIPLAPLPAATYGTGTTTTGQSNCQALSASSREPGTNAERVRELPGQVKSPGCDVRRGSSRIGLAAKSPCKSARAPFLCQNPPGLQHKICARKGLHSFSPPDQPGKTFGQPTSS